jgi:hydrogenase maturation factor
MENRCRSKQPAEITINYTRSNYSDTNNLLAEALKEVFEAAEAEYRAGLIKTNNNQ